MADDLLYFNGVNGDTDDYDLDPMTAARLFDVLRGVAEPENIKELKYRVGWETEAHLGVGATMEIEMEWARRSDDVLRAETDIDEVLFRGADRKDGEQ